MRSRCWGVSVCWWFIERGTTKRHRLDRLSRPFRRTQPEGFGLLLEDAKTILGQLQNAILLDQIEEISEASRICPDCDGGRAVHDYRSRVLDTLFGRFQVKVPRIRRCACTAKSDVVLGGPLSPLSHFFPDRSTPELRRLQAELGARHSFREAARILETFLPCAKQVNTSVRNRLGKVARDICDSELTEPVFAEAAEDAPGLTVFVDGAHIRCRPEYQKRHLDVVVGKIESHDKCRRFGLVQQAVLSPACQLRQDLSALDWDHRQTVTVISDGEPALPNLVRDAVGGKVRHILDWWHISMRIQHVENAVKGLLQIGGFSGIPVLFTRPAETLRWYLWHGKVMTAATRLQWLMVDCARLNTGDRMAAEATGRVQARCRDLYSYLANTMGSLTDYGRRYRRGLPISSSRAEGCVDDIGNTRMGKRRRMRWSPSGAHRVAVVRAAVLDGRLTGAHQRAAA
ncbi:ISKra4 family transposase [Paracoccus sp. R12_1]|uniref:ISKra4 family transposase n=1 Tax=unclassified Paracoccus (in: a-proteobacteria) TaxID=2688777 RepID=UPI001AD96976|nr:MULTISPECIES: ISKra4 family transposase [unclassified Paracoccus (in: a-proteobacteria)]MBO9457299.1 ISKra4 family transposase [Paracoccus sp. R12_2]MBO9488582.1 ISKra4 family transposase [Paracoccus sp. R12_1]